jgi:general secretion pathway protein L
MPGARVNLKQLLDTDVDTIGQWFRIGYHWWIDELLGLVPPRWKSRFERKGELTAHVDGARFTVMDADGNAVDATTLGAAQRKMDVVLAPGLVLTRVIDVPAMRIGDVLKMIAFDLDRIMPFPAGAAYSDAEIVQRNEASGTQKVRVGVIGRDTADTILSGLEAAGIAPLTIGVAGPTPGSVSKLDFLRDMRQARGQSSSPTFSRILWIVVIALFLFNIVALIYRDSSQLDTLRDVTASQGNVVAIARRLRERVDSGATQRDALLASRAKSDPMRVLDAVSRTLPRDAWVQKFDWDGTRLHLAGYGASSTGVLAALKQDPLLKTARSTLPATPGGQTGDHQPFDIIAIIGGTKP